MDALMICLVACALASVGGRWWQLASTVATSASGRGAMILSAVIAAAASAWFAFVLMAQIRGPGMQLMLGLALIIAGAGLLWHAVRRPSKAADANHGLAAAIILLLAAQLSESAPFIVFSAALATREPLFAALGGAVGIITAGWLAGSMADDPRVSRILWLTRLAGGGAMLLTGGVTALSALGLL